MSLRRANKRISQSLRKEMKLAARVGDPGTRTTVPKLGDQTISGIYKRNDRISLDDLERAYRMDELVFGIINKYITTMTSNGYIIDAKRAVDAKVAANS